MNHIDNEPTAKWWRCDHVNDLKIKVRQEPRMKSSTNSSEWWDCDDPYPESVPLDRVTVLDTVVDVNGESITCYPDKEYMTCMSSSGRSGLPMWIAIHSIRPPLAGRWRPVVRPETE